MYTSKIKERTFPFMRGYEELVNEYGLKLDVVDGELQIVDLGSNFGEDLSYYLYLEELTDRVMLDIVVVTKQRGDDSE